MYQCKKCGTIYSNYECCPECGAQPEEEFSSEVVEMESTVTGQHTTAVIERKLPPYSIAAS
jgi:predicted  nucleic acid-binding Zn-ribbon protein